MRGEARYKTLEYILVMIYFFYLKTKIFSTVLASLYIVCEGEGYIGFYVISLSFGPASKNNHNDRQATSISSIIYSIQPELPQSLRLHLFQF